MAKFNLFPWLVDYHHSINLETCLRNYPLEHGRLLVDEKPLKEGSDKKTPHNGFLFVANGNFVLNDLIRDRMIHDPRIDTAELVRIHDEDDFIKYLLRQEEHESDGAYVFDSVDSLIVKVHELNNNPNNLPKNLSLETMIPDDFVFYHKGDNSRIGTKTRLAIRIPHAYPNTETYQIKRSSYANLGLGKVTHFNKQGLIEEFFFDSTKNNQVYGVYRAYYRNEEGDMYKILEKRINMGSLGNFTLTYKELKPQELRTAV